MCVACTTAGQDVFCVCACAQKVMRTPKKMFHFHIRCYRIFGHIFSKSEACKPLMAAHACRRNQIQRQRHRNDNEESIQ